MPQTQTTDTALLAPRARTAQYGVLSFPNLCAIMGGVSYVRWSARYAWLSLPGRTDTVRLKRSELPPVSEWSSFSLADAAHAALAKIRL